jgi:hypothetical protein
VVLSMSEQEEKYPELYAEEEEDDYLEEEY